jgi:DNA transformation protein
MSSTRKEFAAYVQELMAGWATVSVRKMFGGYGLFRDGLMFALIVEDELFLKTDADNVAMFERAGSHPFVYQSKVRAVQMSYWSAPAASLESPDEMDIWCRSAYGAAISAQAVKVCKSGKGK